MKKLRKYEKLTPVLENILNIIRSQVKTCLEYVKNHPNCQDIQIHSVETSQDCYDVYMASAEDITYNKPVDGLLSEDLLNNADYEMDDNAQQIYVYEDEEDDDEDDDDEDSQNRSETWEYGYCSEDDEDYIGSSDSYCNYSDDCNYNPDSDDDYYCYNYYSFVYCNKYKRNDSMMASHFLIDYFEIIFHHVFFIQSVMDYQLEIISFFILLSFQ